MRGNEEQQSSRWSLDSIRKRADAYVERRRYGFVFRLFVGLNSDEPLWISILAQACACHTNRGHHIRHPEEGPCVVLLSNFPSCEEAMLRLRCGQEEARNG